MENLEMIPNVFNINSKKESGKGGGGEGLVKSD